MNMFFLAPTVTFKIRGRIIIAVLYYYYDMCAYTLHKIVINRTVITAVQTRMYVYIVYRCERKQNFQIPPLVEDSSNTETYGDVRIPRTVPRVFV